jgi:UDP-4-amino-4,6-dideoxy-N-acetyl-beta-L-altrosamine N-acetyltransferase
MILKGKKTILRPIKLSDAPRFVRWMNDPEIIQYLSIRNPVTLEGEKEWIKSLKKNKNDIILAIDTDKGVHIGSIGIHRINKEHQRATLGINIGDKNYWGKGYGSDVFRSILKYCFGELGLHRVELEVHETNPRAKRMYEKSGFIFEGVKRQANLHDGKFYDNIVMSILKQEWEKKK